MNELKIWRQEAHVVEIKGVERGKMRGNVKKNQRKKGQCKKI